MLMRSAGASFGLGLRLMATRWRRFYVQIIDPSWIPCGLAFKNGEPDENCTAQVIKEDIHVTLGHIRTELQKVIDEIGGAVVDWESAEIIVSSRHGAGNPEDLALIQELDEVLGA